MSAVPRPASIADLPAQLASEPASKAEERARYFNTGNAFNVQLPAVPNAVFVDEAVHALDPTSVTGFTTCDASAVMQCASPATSPLLLARYARINAGESLRADFNASGIVHYVICGSGSSDVGGERIEWRRGDVFVAPGGVPVLHSAGDEAAVLWVVSNEPQLDFENLRAPAPDNAPTRLVHYPAEEIDRQIDLIYNVGRDEQIAGSALIFSSDLQQDSRNVLPTLTLAMNSLPPGVTQRPHRHNSVAVSLVIRGEHCYSMIDGERKDWAPWATTITPPVSVHSHHNEGKEQAMFLIVQDGGLFYHARAMGFEFVEN